jgi:hypothetical protein
MPWNFKEVSQLPFTQLYGAIPSATTSGYAGMISMARGRVNNTFMRRWNGLFAQTNDTWSLPKIRGYTGQPYIDPNYTTMFVNLQYMATTVAGGSANTSFLPSIGSQTSQWSYNYHTDAPDGWVNSLLCVDDTSISTSNNKIGPGIGNLGYYFYTDTGSYGSRIDIVSKHGTPTQKSSCLIYLSDTSAGATSPGFYPIEYSNRASTLSGNTYTLFAGVSSHRFQRFGATPATNTTKTGFRYTVEQFLEWLLYKDFANAGQGSRGPMSSRPTRNYSRGKGKSSRRGKSSKPKMSENDEKDEL